MTNQDLRDDGPVRGAAGPGLSGTLLAVSAAMAGVVSAVIYGFFDWAPLWFHVFVFAGTFALRLAYGRRLSASD
ncbi:MAG: hypothetical protein AB1592_14380 [Pseudomonadota bacterium]